MIARGLLLGLEVLAGLLLLALMTITGLDVVGRYILNAPLPGAFEMTELLLGALVFAALPLVSRAGGHVEVDLLVAFLPNGVLKALGIIAGIVSAGMLCFFAWWLGWLGSHQWADGARSVSLHIPFAPIAFFAAAACVLAAVFSIFSKRPE